MLDGLVRRHTEKQGSGGERMADKIAAPGRLLPGSYSEPIADGLGDYFLAGLSSARDDDPPVVGDLTAQVRGPLARTTTPPSQPSNWAKWSSGRGSPDSGCCRQHARGGIGVVFVAQDSELHREVALKQIQIQHADDPDSRARFLIEAEVTGRLEHPGIVPVYKAWRQRPGSAFLRDAIRPRPELEGGHRQLPPECRATNR